MRHVAVVVLLVLPVLALVVLFVAGLLVVASDPPVEP